MNQQSFSSRGCDTAPSLAGLVDAFLKLHESLVLREDHRQKQQDLFDGGGEDSSG